MMKELNPVNMVANGNWILLVLKTGLSTHGQKNKRAHWILRAETG
jgi:hypothetical protein